jgi:hypothetical protein
MTFQLQIDKNSFQFHIILLGMNPIKDDATSLIKANMYKFRSNERAVKTLWRTAVNPKPTNEAIHRSARAFFASAIVIIRVMGSIGDALKP